MHQVSASLRAGARNVSTLFLDVTRNSLALVGLASIAFVFIVVSRAQSVAPDEPLAPRNLAAAADHTLRLPVQFLAGVLSVPAEKFTALLGLNHTEPVIEPQQLVPAHNLNGPKPRAVEAPVEKKAQDGIGKYLVRRYRISNDAVNLLVSAAYETGRQFAIEPSLLLAVMAIESGFNPFAESVMGAQGLMQVMSRIHGDKLEDFGGVRAALNPVANMKVGALILKDCIRRGGSVADGLRLYSGAGIGDDGGYGSRVLQEQERILAAAGVKLQSGNAAVAGTTAPAKLSLAAQRVSAS